MNAQFDIRQSQVEISDLISVGAFKLISAIEAGIDAVSKHFQAR